MHLPIHRKELNSLAWNAASWVWSSVFLSIHPKIWNTGTNGNCPRKIHLLKQNACHPLFPTSLWNGFWEWEIVAGRSQFWLHIGSSFFDLLFIAFVITITHTDLPQKTLSLCLFVKLKSLCSAHRESDCPPVNSYSKKKKLIHHFQRFTLSGDVLQRLQTIFTSFLHCFSFSILPFDFSPSLFLSLWLYKRTWHPDSKRWLLWDIQFSHSVMTDSLRPHRLQQARLPFPSPSPRACSNSSPSSWWCHPIISSSVVPFSYCLQSFPASGAFPIKTWVCHLLSQLAFWIKSYSLPQHIVSWIHWPVMWWGEQTWTQ